VGKRVIAGGFASAGPIAWTFTSKYRDHLPLYRQQKMLEHWGAPISRNLNGSEGAATALLEPLVKEVNQNLLQGG
jgi:transposase